MKIGNALYGGPYDKLESPHDMLINFIKALTGWYKIISIIIILKTCIVKFEIIL